MCRCTSLVLLLTVVLLVSTSAGEELPRDWTMWGGTSHRHNATAARAAPLDWDIGGFDRETRRWQREKSRNIKWAARLGSQTYGTPVVADGRIFIGTNNAAGYIERYPPGVDLSCLLCFRERDGEFLWQLSCEKLKTGRANDWPMQGLCSTPLVERGRLWVVTNRCELLCLNTKGNDDGEADVVWRIDMWNDLGVRPHNMSSCSPAGWRNLLFVVTGNGVDASHIDIPAPDAPSFIAVDKDMGHIVWKDNSPGKNILHGQWGSPAAGVLGGMPQVIFPGGDGWLYSFHAEKYEGGKPILLWKFDANAKESKWILGGRGRRNNIVCMPLIHNGRVYFTVGQDPEHGEGYGALYCLDPTKRGDVSAELVVRDEARTEIVPPRRNQAVRADLGEAVIENPNSAVVWKYEGFDLDCDGKLEFFEQMHRAIATPVIKDDLLFINDFSGLLHCVDISTGRSRWTADLLAMTWASPLLVNDHVYIGDEDGDIAIVKADADPRLSLKLSNKSDPTDIFGEPLREMYMHNSVYTTPVMANGVLYIANRTHLFAIEVEK